MLDYVTKNMFYSSQVKGRNSQHSNDFIIQMVNMYAHWTCTNRKK